MTSLFYGDIGHEPNLEQEDAEPVPRCPICGAETDTFYKGYYEDIVGCSECVESVDAWEEA